METAAGGTDEGGRTGVGVIPARALATSVCTADLMASRMASGDKVVPVELGGGGEAEADIPEVAAGEEESDDIGAQLQEGSCIEEQPE